MTSSPAERVSAPGRHCQDGGWYVLSEPGIRLIRRRLDWELSPADVLRLVGPDAHPVALFGAWAGGSDMVASEPVQVRQPPNPLADVLDSSWPGAFCLTDQAGSGGQPMGQRECAFGGGWIGYLGFGAASAFLPVPPAPGGSRQLPAWWFGYYDHVLRRDRATGRWDFEALWTAERADALEDRFQELSRRAQLGVGRSRGYSCAEFRLVPSAGEHKSAVGRAIEYIRQGDIFQANICLRLEAGFAGDALDAFARAARQLDPPYAAFLGIAGGAVASFSPELFLRRAGNTVVTRPIKGTRYRPADDAGARREREILLDSGKDRAENVMIVDLMRNDLSRVCAPGSVHVPRLLAAEAHPGLWHLVSDVQGTLPSGTGDGDLIAATFPPGSVTGAPKVRAMEVIHELESTPREVYTGAIGYRSPLAGLELNVAIRTFEFSGERAWLGAGGGITARSDPGEEYQECLVKATPLVRAIGAGINDQDSHRPGGHPAGARVRPSMRPRPAAGVFTTLRVAYGQTHDLGRHLARLENSTRQLYGKDLPPGVRTELDASLSAEPSGRLRITARPNGGPLKVTVEAMPAAPPPAAVTLRPVTIPGGLGAHKWRDRRLLADLTALAGAGPEEHLLIQDQNEDILETDRANIFAVIEGVLHTPAADGRLLPGTTRAAVLRIASTQGIPTKAARMTPAHLRRASEVFVTNAMHGAIPVRAVAGTAAWEDGPVTAAMAVLLDSRPTALPGSRPATRLRIASPVPRHSRYDGAAPDRAAPDRPLAVVIDNYDSFTYNLAHLLLRNRCQVEVVRNDEVTAEDIAAFHPDGIVISPGPCTPADAGISVDTVRVCGAATPLLGICLGHQAIAAAFGGHVIRAAEPVHGQATPIIHDGRGVLYGLPQEFAAARYHSLLISEDSLPASLAVSARTPEGLPMGLRHTGQPTEGIQFHPESILTEYGEAMMATFRRIMRTYSAQTNSAETRHTAAGS
jgi:para-aminobenzoate synthetase / 4-amino-4-deoxychorismate lyase